MSKIDRKESDQNVIKLANKNAGMNSYTQNSDRLSLPIEIWKLIKVYKQVLIICMMASVTAYFAYYLYSKPKYKASATIGATTKRAYKTVNEALGYLMNSTDEELNGNINAIIDYFNSPEAKNLIEERLLKSKIDDKFLAQSKLDAILANHGFERSLQRVDVLLRDGAKILNLVEIKVFSNPDTRTVIAEAISSNSELAVLAANITAKVLVEWNHKMDVKTLLETKALLSKQEEELKTKLHVLESDLAQFQSTNQILAGDEAQSMSYQGLEKAKVELKQTEQKIDLNNKLIDLTNSEIKTVTDQAAKGSSAAGWQVYVTQLQNRLGLLQYQISLAADARDRARLQKEYNSISQRYNKALNSTEHTVFITSDPVKYINTLKENIKKFEQENGQLKIKQAVLVKNLNYQKKDLSKLAIATQKLSALKRNVNLANDLYIALKKKIQEIDIQELGTVDTLSIISDAEFPKKALGPPIIPSIAFTVFLGLFAGIVIMIIRENMVKVVRGREDLEKENITYLAHIPKIKLSKQHTGLKNPVFDLSSNIYRAMRIKIVSFLFLQEPEKNRVENQKVILVTSPTSGNGKSFFSYNFAFTMARAMFKTVLVDVDLRKHKQKPESIDGQALTEKIIVNEIEIKRIITTIGNNLDYMSFEIPEHVDPAEILEATSVHGLLKGLQGKYQFVILDSPPVIGIIDPVLLAPEADLVILVTQHRKTSLIHLNIATTEIREVTKTPIFGIINFVHKEYSSHNEALEYYSKKYKKAS